MSHPKILDRDALVAQRAALRDAGKVVVQCHGCFDIVHPGHIRYLRFAKDLGDVLVVSVSSDAVVGKGYDRPYIHEELRLENLAALEFVDFVVLDDNTWAGPILDAVRPDIYVKGKEYERKADPRFTREKELVEAHGGRVVFSSGDVVYSSTAIISRYREAFALDGEKIAFYCRRHGIDRASVDALLDKLSGKRVLVLGDPIVDRYIHCESARIAAEGPILSVRPVVTDTYAGGAGLIAGQLAALGADVTFLTCAADGPVADELTARLEQLGVTTVRLPDDARDVYVKSRYIVEDRKVLKVDEGRHGPPSTVAVDALLAALERALPDHDALVVTDFGYGLFNLPLCEGVVAAAKRHGVPYYADVSTAGQANVLKFRGPRLATPTEAELRWAFADNESGLAPLAARYYADSGAERLVITLGKRGALLFHAPEPGDDRLATDYLPAMVTDPVDTVGAGDVFLATMALCDLAGAPTQRALYLASAVASLHVRRLGNDPVGAMDLRAHLDARPELRQR